MTTSVMTSQIYAGTSYDFHSEATETDNANTVINHKCHLQDLNIDTIYNRLPIFT